MKTVTIATHLPAIPNRVWEEVNKPCLLFFVAHPMIQFKPVDPPELPERLEDGEYVVRMRWYGIVPLGRQIINISRPAPKGDVRFLRDNGRSAFIRCWDHLISVARMVLAHFTRIELRSMRVLVHRLSRHLPAGFIRTGKSDGVGSLGSASTTLGHDPVSTYE